MRLFFLQGFTTAKASKIVTYAIGEIILIVVGILIAFQLSNWADNRKARKIELESLRNLKESLKRDQKDLELNIGLYTQVINSCDTILAMLQNKISYETKMNKYFSPPCMAVVFISNIGPYETIKSRGLESISNDFIRNKIIRLYEDDYSFLKRVELQLLDYTQFVEKNFYPSHFDQSVPYRWKNTPYGDMVPLDFGKLKQDREYSHYIRTIRNKTDFILQLNYQRTKKRAGELVNDLDSAIMQLE